MILLVPAISLFEMIFVRKKDRGRDVNRLKEYSRIKVNLPRDVYPEKYSAGKAWCQRQDMRDCHIKSIDGIPLHAYYLPAEDAERYVILSHGYRGSGFGDFANIARYLHENGCNLLFIDHRGCGQSGGRYITFGAMERYDIYKWTRYIAAMNDKKLPVYLYGMSMGASSVLMAAGFSLSKEVKGIIADCGFSTARRQFSDIAAGWFNIKWMGPMLLRFSLLCRLFAGFRLRDADTSRALETNHRPVLFFHGDQDNYVNLRNTLINYRLCRAPKELAIVRGAGHLGSSYAAPRQYRRKILDFFQKYDNSGR